MIEQDTTGNKGIDVTRQKTSQSEPLVLEVLKTISYAVFIFQITGDRSVAIPYASEQFFSSTGLQPDEVTECAALLLSRMHPADIEPFFTSAQASAKVMAPWRLEFRLDHPDKNEIWIEWSATPVMQNGMLSWHGMLLDITERKTRQQHSKLLEEILNQCSDAVFLVNEELSFEYVNDVTCRYLGYSREELLGRQLMEIGPEFDLTTASDMTQSPRMDEPFCFETGLLAKDGSLFPVDINAPFHQCRIRCERIFFPGGENHLLNGSTSG
jgi:PAS domain S-box-containing protein